MRGGRDEAAVSNHLVALVTGQSVEEVQRESAASSARIVKVGSATPTAAKQQMQASTHRMLAEFYAPFNKELEQLLGRGLGWNSEVH